VTAPNGKGRGHRKALSPLQEIELRAWANARKALGTPKQKADELGVSIHTIYAYIHRQRVDG
jgi:DNA-binding CsgD family transcriptional regulator